MEDFKNFLLDVEKNKKNTNFMSVTTSMQHPTGFMYLDYGCGSYLNVYDDDEIPMFNYHNIGISSGSVNTVISKSQGGKTTLCVQLGAAIIEPYVNPRYYLRYIKENATKKDIEAVLAGMSFIQIADIEKTFTMDYAKKLCHFTNKQLNKRVIINQISTDTELIKLIEAHVKYKTTHMSPQINPILDVFGKPFKDYPPTVLIIDSMSQIVLEAVDDDKIDDKKSGLSMIYDSATQNTAGARRAKAISALYSQMVNIAKKYNIIIFSINHINKSLPVNGIPTKSFRGLRANESLSNGERAIYLSSSILRLDVIKSVNSTSASAVNLGDDVTGFITIASWIKCKSNSKSNTCHLGYTDMNGYDQLLSNLWHAKEVGDLDKKGNFYHLDDYPEYLFTMKNYTEVFGNHPEMFSALYDQLRDKCEKLLDNADDAERRNKKLFKELRDDIHNDESLSHSDMEDLDDMFSSLVND